MIKRWVLVNIIFLVLIVIWSFWTKDFISPIVLSAKTIALIAFVLFAVNVNMYFIFFIIRKSKNKQIKKNLALFSRKMMKVHVPIAITATAFILLHAYLMLQYHPIDLLSIKKVTGILAIIVLSVHLFSGWLRRKKASGFRRKFHLRMAFTFLTFMLIHVFN